MPMIEVDNPRTVELAFEAMLSERPGLVYANNHSIYGRVVKIERVSARTFHITTEE